MAQLIADKRDIDFVLYEQMGAGNLPEQKRFQEFNKKTFDMIVTEARNFAVKELLPTNSEGDRQGVRFDNGSVAVPECFQRPFRLLLEGEWTSLTEDPAVGGQGLPRIVSQAVSEYLFGANYTLTVYAFEGHGTGKMIELYGTEEQKNLFLKKLYTGEWGGTMDLTEPQAGSDVGAVETSARKLADGTYAITGNKIFITNGEHDLVDNIIHPVLARVEGAPKGTRGISLFIVPKFWVNEDGSQGERNDIVCTGVEEKMGIHASATCSMGMGGKGTCRGMLLGEENQGMQIMFHMMNEARLDVGFMGFVQASAAYLQALAYARERRQGRDLEKGKDPEAPSVPIIRHPDVRRMLAWMKAHVDGMRSFIYYVCALIDGTACAEAEEERRRMNDFIDLFTPVVKAYCATRGFEVCVQAMQVHGGYGYIREYQVEQRARDAKIASIFEGTDGIQAMDFMGRKLGMKDGAVFEDFLGEVVAAAAAAAEVPELTGIAEKVSAAAVRLRETAGHLGKTVVSENFKVAFAHAHPFLEATGDVIMAWMLLWRARLAVGKLAGSLKPREKDFYRGQVNTAEFYIQTVLPVADGRMEAILGGSEAALDIPEAGFGG